MPQQRSVFLLHKGLMDGYGQQWCGSVPLVTVLYLTKLTERDRCPPVVMRICELSVRWLSDQLVGVGGGGSWHIGVVAAASHSSGSIASRTSSDWRNAFCSRRMMPKSNECSEKRSECRYSTRRTLLLDFVVGLFLEYFT